MHHLDEGEFQRCQKPDGRPPGTGSPADIKICMGFDLHQTGDDRKLEPGQQREWKYLTLVCMARGLKVKITQGIQIRDGSVL
jgi:hypothetical protein